MSSADMAVDLGLSDLLAPGNDSAPNDFSLAADMISSLDLAVPPDMSSNNRWVAVGTSVNDNGDSIAYSSDGITWTGVTNSNSIFSTGGNGVAWNGARWVAVGTARTRLPIPPTASTWTGLGTSIFSSYGMAMALPGTAPDGWQSDRAPTRLPIPLTASTWTGVSKATRYSQLWQRRCLERHQMGGSWSRTGREWRFYQQLYCLFIGRHHLDQPDQQNRYSTLAMALHGTAPVGWQLEREPTPLPIPPTASRGPA